MQLVATGPLSYMGLLVDAPLQVPTTSLTQASSCSKRLGTEDWLASGLLEVPAPMGNCDAASPWETTWLGGAGPIGEVRVSAPTDLWTQGLVKGWPRFPNQFQKPLGKKKPLPLGHPKEQPRALKLLKTGTKRQPCLQTRRGRARTEGGQAPTTRLPPYA